MTVDEAIENANDWIKRVPVYEGSSGWRIACKVLADEVERLRLENTKISKERDHYRDRFLDQHMQEMNKISGGRHHDGSPAW